ncbi:hypothetical protein ACFL3M_02785 [Patescibacteria group bacterium]
MINLSQAKAMLSVGITREQFAKIDSFLTFEWLVDFKVGTGLNGKPFLFTHTCRGNGDPSLENWDLSGGSLVRIP